MNYSLLKRLTETPGISGREDRVRDLLLYELSRFKTAATVDALGNLIVHVGGKGPRVALIAHMDEIGFMVSKVEKEGFVRVMPVGGIDPQIFGGQKVIVHGARDLPGVVGSVPPHLRSARNAKDQKEAVPIEESFVDVGLAPDEAARLVTVGDPVTFATESWEDERCFFGKALDDRVGLFVMLSAIERVQEPSCDLYLVASTQEEYGLRGAGTALFTVAPQIALALEGTVASDTPGLKLPANVQSTEQGKGPELRLSDRRMIADRRLADFLTNLASRHKIPCQRVVKNTGATDAAQAQVTGAGMLAGTISVPTRYIHAPIGMVRKDDVASTVDLIAAFLKNLNGFGLPEGD